MYVFIFVIVFIFLMTDVYFCCMSWWWQQRFIDDDSSDQGLLLFHWTAFHYYPRSICYWLRGCCSCCCCHCLIWFAASAASLQLFLYGCLIIINIPPINQPRKICNGRERENVFFGNWKINYISLFHQVFACLIYNLCVYVRIFNYYYYLFCSTIFVVICVKY